MVEMGEVDQCRGPLDDAKRRLLHKETGLWIAEVDDNDEMETGDWGHDRVSNQPGLLDVL